MRLSWYKAKLRCDLAHFTIFFRAASPEGALRAARLYCENKSKDLRSKYPFTVVSVTTAFLVHNALEAD
jgi:hypothetical protein